MVTKKELRTAMRLKRSGLSEIKIGELSLQAQSHILKEPAWKEAASVGLYNPINKEVDTALLKTTARERGKQTCFPCTEPAGIMSMLPCNDDSLLVRSAFGILEPRPETSPLSATGKWMPDLMIVPGLSFDRRGHRLGYAGGYYDRFFARQSVTRIGLCYGFQLVDTLPVEEWDIPMHAIATEEGIIWL